MALRAAERTFLLGQVAYAGVATVIRAKSISSTLSPLPYSTE
jgi:hypothetical protein